MNRLLSLGITIAAVSASTSGCAENDPTPAGPLAGRVGAEAPGTHLRYGTPVSLGLGRARTYVIVDQKGGVPLEVGVALDERALDGLPSAPPAGEDNHGAHGNATLDEYILRLPEGHGTPFRFVQLDWRSAGHEPAGVYDAPHFDFHFYTVEKAERDAILLSDPEFAAKANHLPSGAEVPPFYVPLAPPSGTPADLAVPMMGVHWIDTRSPELQGLLGKPDAYRPFTTTFLYGSWNGRFTFLEPMITRAYIVAKKTAADPAVRNEVIQIPVPARVRTAGFYPAGYRIAWSAESREYRIALTRLTPRN